MSGIIKRKRGRPSKNKMLDLNKIDHNINVNYKNIFPPNKISVKRSANILHKDDIYSVKLSFNKPKIFQILLDGFKGKQKDINIIFKKKGMIFSQGLTTKNDMTRFECIILSDNLKNYCIKNVEVIKVEIINLLKILKTIPKDSQFSMVLRKTKEDTKEFAIIYSDIEKNKHDLHRLDINDIIGYNEVSIPSNCEYDVIVMMESTEFLKLCQNMSLFTKIFTIAFSKNNNKYIIEFIYKDNESYIGTSSYTSSKKFKFLKVSDKYIKNTYNLSSFIKYTKSNKFSTIVKLYISVKYPLIIEYSVEPGLGVFQILVESQNNINYD